MSAKKLHLKLFDQYGNVIFDDFIFHIEAYRFQTQVYTTERIFHESDVIRLTEAIDHIHIEIGLIELFYKSGGKLEITRQ